ncbi:MAG: DUF2975 domain-containing protein [Pseudomonadota bacterium]|nr:DUF2975 domain-containing protein [Pseudomonadota bacterium]MDQ3160125.1 DUF2975 domain-containing protein [Pseudomonadota bacterium]
MTMPTRFRAQCRLLRIATLIVFFGLALLSLGLIGLIGLPGWHPPGMVARSGIRETLSLLVPGLPALGYLWALWAVQRALADLAGGRMFHPTVARAMRHIGIGVLTGALLNVFVVINLSRMLRGGHGSYLNFDLSGIVLGVVGTALILLANLIDQARELQAELDEIL